MSDDKVNSDGRARLRWLGAFSCKLVEPDGASSARLPIGNRKPTMDDLAKLGGISNDRGLIENLFTDEVWSQMGEDLRAKCTSLATMRLVRCGVTPKHLDALFGGANDDREGGEEEPSGPPLTSLCLRGNKDLGRGVEGLVEMLPGVVRVIHREIRHYLPLGGLKTLKSLDLSNCFFTDRSVQSLTSAIRNLRITKLHLQDNLFEDAGIISVLNLPNAKNFVDLRLDGNAWRRASCRDAIIGFVMLRASNLVRFGIDMENKKHVSGFFASLRAPKLLELEGKIGNKSQKCRDEIRYSVASALIGLGDFDDTVNANHRLKKIGCHTELYREKIPILDQLLALNGRDISEGAKIRWKLQKFYFESTVELFGLRPLLRLGGAAALIPRVLSIVSTDEITVSKGTSDQDARTWKRSYHEVPGQCVNAMYRLVRHCFVQDIFGNQIVKEDRLATLEDENARKDELIRQLRAENEKLRSQLVEDKRPRKRAKKISL
ncbi:hypothetical protein THAOC_13835 [Thalassiosira oceanica]|uniref:Uncharacterized protein n=1 Tax=Thalassiosira oceanica TaxID=159749 RepID=K0SWF5_THAOC|nr:hypothetical protein THAOC_13835 [Thalassiosira oceanica]|eukprot:EJK65316.1 hypothetical protein THAOC_13835 [Thalassiosira oceanica]